jgi:hypothetical protein
MAQEAFDKSGKFRNRIDQLARQTYLAFWPTPMAGTPVQKGYNEAGNTDSSRKTVALVTDGGETPSGSPAGTGKCGQLNPAHSRWLQGCPEAWDRCSPNYDDWRKWQDFMAAHSSGPRGTAPEG